MGSRGTKAGKDGGIVEVVCTRAAERGGDRKMESELAERKHFVLVHTICHGAWSWYKLATLLAVAGHKVTTPDLAGCGADARRLNDVGTFHEHSRPLMEVMGALPPGEKVVLVGHGFGGMSAALAMERFPEKVAVAIFVSAFLPDTSSTPSHIVDEYFRRYPPHWMDIQLSFIDRGSSKPLTAFLFGPKIYSSVVCHGCSPEDITLGNSLIRVDSFFLDDLALESPFSEKGYGSVRKICIICGEDLILEKKFQLWMTENYAVDEVKVVEGAGHMAILSKPLELLRELLDVANMYA